jgi:rare lipoprotein A (peptidoglycan hydrolase)
MQPMLKNAIAVACLLVGAMSVQAETGVASVYSGERTANGEYAHAHRLTAAHKSLPFGTLVTVTNEITDTQLSCASTIAGRSCAAGS